MLIDCQGTTEEWEAVFSDRSVLDAMLRFETELARAQARLGLIPQGAAETIAACSADEFDAAAIAREARSSASVAIPFVKELRSRAGDFVHFGATSQDVIDTTLVLLLGRSKEILERDHRRLDKALRALSDRHKDTVMLARTLLQPALPTTFGNKVAGWYGAIARSWRRVVRSFEDVIRIQFGGASGTLAAYGDRGAELAVELSKGLNLRASAPWHAHRDRLAALAADLCIYTGSLGKIARDISLLMQFEVGEVSEAGGGSSAMPHKRNPAGSAIALAAATRAPALASGYLAAIVQEHERAAGSWQSEWQTIRDIVCGAGSALSAMAASIETLEVFPEKMRANLEATHGAVLSEKAAILLAPKLGAGAARDAVADAVRQAHAQKRPLAEILKIDLGAPEEYLGCAEAFRRQSLEESE